jgi:hypothetical protein
LREQIVIGIVDGTGDAAIRSAETDDIAALIVFVHRGVAEAIGDDLLAIVKVMRVVDLFAEGVDVPD